MSRILIVDSHAVARAGYRQVLEKESTLEIGEAEGESDMFEQLSSSGWDLLLLDLDMSETKGLPLLANIRSKHPKMPILVLSELPESVYARDAIRTGASGYLSKSGTAEEVQKAVRTTLAGHRYVSSKFAEILAEDLGTGTHEPVHNRLSAREFQIFCKLAQGLRVSRIARELSLSVKTISTYRTRALGKMTLHSNAELTAYALRNKLID
jgi:two-component system, NarL family, invasion response regulator UvrY